MRMPEIASVKGSVAQVRCLDNRTKRLALLLSPRR